MGYKLLVKNRYICDLSPLASNTENKRAFPIDIPISLAMKVISTALNTDMKMEKLIIKELLFFRSSIYIFNNEFFKIN